MIYNPPIRKSKLAGIPSYAKAELPPAPNKPIWRHVPDPYDEIVGYKIDQHGRVLSDDRPRFGRRSCSDLDSFVMDDELIEQCWKHGLRCVRIQALGAGTTKSVGRMLCETFPTLYPNRKAVLALPWMNFPKSLIKKGYASCS